MAEAHYSPMKAQPITELPADGTGSVMEVKIDGWRAFFARHDEATVLSATGKRILSTPYFNEWAANLPAGTVLDGEIAYLGHGSEEWKQAQSICSRGAALPDDPQLTFMAFDLLELMGNDVKDKPLSTRKELLSTLLGMAPQVPFVQMVESLPVTDEALARILAEGFEGVVVKRTDGIYVPGSRQWLKLKPQTEIEVTITGMYDPDPGSKYDGYAVGGFTFHVEHPDGRTYDGRCGTGIDDELRIDMEVNSMTYVGRVAELAHYGIGDEGALRHPVLKRIRDKADKAVAEVREPVSPNPVAESNGGWADGLPPDAIKALQAVNQPIHVEVLLDQLLAAIEDRDHWRAEAEHLQLRLDATLRGIVANPPINRKPVATQAAGKRPRTRNYRAMTTQKLRQTISDLQRGSGQGYETAISRGEDPTRALQLAKQAAAQKGVAI